MAQLQAAAAGAATLQPLLTPAALGAALALAACWLLAALAALAAAVNAHELAHLLVARAAGLAAAMHAGPAAILRVLDPRPPTPAAMARLPHVAVSAAAGASGAAAATAAALLAARHAGWVASAALAAAAAAARAAWAPTAAPLLAAALHAALCSCLLVLACSLPTDLLQWTPCPDSHQEGANSSRHGCACGGAAAAPLRFFCGNLGLLLASVTRARESGVEPLEVLQREVAISMMRGAQSGGLVTLVSPGGAPAGSKPTSRRAGTHLALEPRPRVCGVLRRVAPSKRQSLAELLGSKFKRAVGRSPRYAGDHGLFVGHTRFATSSVPLPSESHPHRWTAPEAAVVWRAAPARGPAGGWAAAPGLEEFCVFITHNGDYDFAMDAQGRYRTHHETSDFLAAVLGSQPPAKCDSVCLAGMMELHRTQGVWAASLRLAVLETAGVPFEQIVVSSAAATGGGLGRGASGKDVEAGECSGSAVISRDELRSLGAALDAALARHLDAVGAETRGGAAGGKPAGGCPQSDVKLPADSRPRGLGDSGGKPVWAAEEGEEKQKGAASQGLTCDAEAEAARKPVAAGAEARRLLAAVGGPAGARRLAAAAAGVLRAGAQGRPAWLGGASVEAVAAAAVDNFIHADLYNALVRVIRAAKGSFGVAATCTADVDRVCLAAWGQPMSIGLCPELGAALYSSEAQNVMLNLLAGGGDVNTPTQANGWRHGHCTHRIDLDEGGGEVLQLVLRAQQNGGAGDEEAGDEEAAGEGAAAGGDGWGAVEGAGGGFLRLRVFCVRRGAEVAGLSAFAGRVVPLPGNPYIQFSPPPAARGLDPVAADISDVPRVLADIAHDWADPASLNRRSAAALADALAAAARARRREAARGGGGGGASQALDVLLVGVEVSLWLAEQLAADLKTMFPGLRVSAISANKLIAVMGSNRGRVPATGFPFCRDSARLDSALALAVSHSGQTFPTIHAVRLLEAMMPGRVWVMTGSVDTKMALALGQGLSPAAPFGARIFDTRAGWRPAEPASVSVLATHHTMTELLLFLGTTLCPESPCGSDDAAASTDDDGSEPGAAPPAAGAGAPPQATPPPFGLALGMDELLDLRLARDAFVSRAAPALAGADETGRAMKAGGGAHAALVAAGRRWALHVLEAPLAWALAAAYIAATVISGYPLVVSIVDAITRASGAPPAVVSALHGVALVFDAAIYIWSGILAACALRLVQRRPLLARWGKRTLVVADVPWVHQCVQAFVSKCFALSYGFASIEVHSANPVDHLVHKHTHRVARGVLLAIGRPDGRLYSQTQTESWVLLALLQAKVIASLGAQPEVLTLGHNPFTNEFIDRHIALPTARPKVLAEVLQCLDAGAGANPNALFAARRHLLAGTVLSDGAARGVRNYRAARLQLAGAAAAGSISDDAAGAAAASCTGSGRAGRSGLTNRRGGGGGGAAQEDGSGGRGSQGSDDLELWEIADDDNMPSLARRPTRVDLLDTKPGSFGAARAPSGRSAGGAGEGGEDGGDGAGGALFKWGPEHHVLGEHRLAACGGGRREEVEDAWRRTVQLAKHHDTLMAGGGRSADASRAATGALASTLTQILEDQSRMEALLESRFNSAERLLAFFVLFHAMAARVASLPPVRFDISRSQSGLRIATTAAPVTASDIERTLAEMELERLLSGDKRHGAAAAAWQSAASRAVVLRNKGDL